MRIAMADLKLDRLTVVHPGSGQFPLDKKIDAMGLDVISAGYSKTRKFAARR